MFWLYIMVYPCAAVIQPKTLLYLGLACHHLEHIRQVT